jgi:hypothetical protein
MLTGISHNIGSETTMKRSESCQSLASSLDFSIYNTDSYKDDSTIDVSDNEIGKSCCKSRFNCARSWRYCVIRTRQSIVRINVGLGQHGRPDTCYCGVCVLSSKQQGEEVHSRELWDVPVVKVCIAMIPH